VPVIVPPTEAESIIMVSVPVCNCVQPLPSATLIKLYSKIPGFVVGCETFIKSPVVVATVKLLPLLTEYVNV